MENKRFVWIVKSIQYRVRDGYVHVHGAEIGGSPVCLGKTDFDDCPPACIF